MRWPERSPKQSSALLLAVQGLGQQILSCGFVHLSPDCTQKVVVYGAGHQTVERCSLQGGQSSRGSVFRGILYQKQLCLGTLEVVAGQYAICPRV